MAYYTLNQELNGIEISFDQKPGADTLTALKSAGYRWHKVKKLWYAKQTAERIALAKSISDGIQPEKTEAKPDIQTELKALYKEIIAAYWKDDKMIDYCTKNAAYIVPLENGDITEIEKPSIETRFCFGYGYCGVSTQEDIDEAYAAERTARTDTDYFIRENMEQIDRYIEQIKDDHIKIYKYVHYCGNCDHRLKGIGFYRYFEQPESNLTECQELTAGERAALLTGYETVRKQFEKRLNTYLKRYGLSKLHTWTYLSD